MKKVICHIFLLSIIAISCEKEPLTLSESIEYGELADRNLIEVAESTLVMNDKDMYVSFDSTSITLSGSMSNYDSLKVGDVITKLSLEDEEDFTYFRKIISISEIGGNTVIGTEEAKLTEAFDRLYFNSRNKSKEVLVYRNDYFMGGLSFKPGNLNVNEIKGFIDPDFDYTFEYDSTQSEISFQYDNVLGIVPRLDMNLVDAKITLDIKVCVGGQGAWGYKNDKILQGEYIPFIFSYPPLALYFNPKVELQLKLKGQVCSPTFTFETSPFSISTSIYPTSTLVVNGFSNIPIPSVTVGTDQDYGGSVAVEGLIGGDFYISNNGPRSGHILKAGMTIGGYTKIGASSKANPYELTAGIKYEAVVGIGAKLFASASLFGGESTTVFGNAAKVGLYYESSTQVLPFKRTAGTFTNTCDKNITNIDVIPDGSNISFRIDCSNCPDKYYVSLNDSLYKNSNGALQEFSYNQLHTVSPNNPLIITNIITFQDTKKYGCFFSDKFTDPAFGHDNCTTITDPRDGDLYCTVNIGGQTWLRENLRHEAAGGHYYDKEETLESVFSGLLYTYEEVLNGQTAGNGPIQGICPPGYHIPTKEEFDQLVANSGGYTQAGKNLKYPNTSFWDDADFPTSGTFNAIGAGEYYSWLDAEIPWWDPFSSEARAFGKRGKSTAYWTSSTYTTRDGYELPYIFSIMQDNAVSQVGLIRDGGVLTSATIPQLGLSCRCIKD